MNYSIAEKAVYDLLFKKHELDPSFTFSVRKKASKGAEADYFIGTKTSNYFGFTCWQVPIYYAGASTDFCDFMVEIANNELKFYFQVSTPNAEEKLESNPSLRLCRYLATQIVTQFNNRGIKFGQTAETNAMLWIGTHPEAPQNPKSYSDLDEFLNKLDGFIDLIVPTIDAAINETKSLYPDFPGKRIDQAQFQHMIDKMNIRQARYKTSVQLVQSETQSEPEEIPLSTAPPIDLEVLPSKNLLLYGPPGTGKTYYLQSQLLEYFKDGDKKRYSFITFHQAFGYEDFIEGLKPETDEKNNNQIQYKVKPGIFYLACNEAAKLAGFDSLSHSLEVSYEEREERFALAPPYALFIDEINRANVSAAFGELITLLESDKRLGKDLEIIDTILPYSKKPFGVPNNLYLIGTMNTADRSVEALDTALRRRFSFRELPPNESLLKNTIGGISLSLLLKTINLRLERLLGREQRIGHAYFISLVDEKGLINAFNYSIIPLLKEYFYGDYRKIGLVLGKKFVSPRITDVQFADFDDDLASEYDEVTVWDINPVTIEAIQAII